MMKEAQIECRDLCLSYDGKTILCEVSFSVMRGDYLCIVGENGSGKSTLIRALLGLKSPTDGEIIFGDGLKQTEIGYLPQQTRVQKDFPASVLEVVLSGTIAKAPSRPFYSREQKRLARENMEKLGIWELRRRPYRELSGGQQQRVLLARALCSAGSLILLDEPVAGLDPLVTKEMYRIIEELNKKENITVIMVSHDLDAALRYSTRILHLNHTVQFFGDTENYTSSSVFGKFKGGQENA